MTDPTNEWGEKETAAQLLDRWEAGNAAEWELLAFIHRWADGVKREDLISVIRHCIGPAESSALPTQKTLTIEEAIAAAKNERFGECENEPLDSFLRCESFEARPDEKRMRAFRLAAMIVSYTTWRAP